jgi:predicted PurR-regulated permease PerM
MLNTNKDIAYIKTYLGIIVAVIFVIILKDLKSIFIPLFLSVLLYFLFNSVVRKMLSWKIPKPLALLILLFFLFVVFYLIGILLFANIASVSENFPKYSDNISRMLENVTHKINIPKLDSVLKSINWSEIAPVLTGTFGTFATFIGNIILVIIFLMFMLAGRESLFKRLQTAFLHEKANKIIELLNSIEEQVQHYLLIKAGVSFITAIISLVILLVGNMDFAIFSAILIFVLNFIPNLGSIAATMFPVLIAIAQKGFVLETFLIIGGLILTQIIIGNVLEPKITGKRINISPLVILISLILWGWMWGIVGMMLAVPITSALKIVFSHIPKLKPISALISNE